MARQELGKIKSVEIGHLENGSPFGVHFELGGESWSVGDYIAWSPAADLIRELLRDAKVRHVGQLVGAPVAVTFDGNVKKSWRILKEVL